eukprot:gene725-961_t
MERVTGIEPAYRAWERRHWSALSRKSGWLGKDVPMRKPTLTHVTLNTVEQCRSAATQVVKAYRLGGHRVIGKVKTSNERVNTLTQLAAKGVDQVADRSEQLIDISAKATATQISKAAKFANSIDNPVLANGLQTAS